jgi:hypothetical protein
MADRSSFHKEEFGVLEIFIFIVQVVTWFRGWKFPLLSSVGTMLYRRLHALTVVVGTFVHPAENIAR